MGSEPIGSWDGREVVVAYDPERYDVQVLPVGPDDNSHLTGGLRSCGWQPLNTAPEVWQTRLNRRVIAEGTWHDCTDVAYEAVDYAHAHNSIHGSTTSAGAQALLTFGAQAREGEPTAARAYGLSVSVRPKGARTVWVRDWVETTRAALNRIAEPRTPPGIEVPGR